MRVIILAVLLWGSTANADRKIDVVARVAEIPPKLGFCGVLAIRAIIRFEVIEVKAGAHQARDVFVGWLCPETLRVGQVYRLTLEPLGKRHQFVDRFPVGPRFRAVRHKRK